MVALPGPIWPLPPKSVAGLLPMKQGTDLNGQTEEVDEPLGVCLPVAAGLVEAGQVFPVKTVAGGAGGHREVALVEFQADGAADRLLSRRHKGIQGLAQRG